MTSQPKTLFNKMIPFLYVNANLQIYKVEVVR